MANDTNQNIPMTTGGCRRWPPAADETGAFPLESPEREGSWIYGTPIQNTGCAGSAAVPAPAAADSTAIPGAVAPDPVLPEKMESSPMPLPGMNGGEVPGGMSRAASQQERMRNPVSMAATHKPGSAQEAYQASLRSLLDRNVGYFVVATFQIGTGQTVTWQGILHTVGSDYLVLYQPDYSRYISCDFYSLKFVQFHNVKGVPYCAASQCWQGQGAY